MKAINISRFLAVLLLTYSISSHADEVGNGGPAIVCRNLNNFSIQFSKPLDSWEGENIYNLNISESDENFLDRIKSTTLFLENYSPKFRSEFLDLLTSIVRNQSYLPDSTGLKLTDDIYKRDYYSKALEKWLVTKNHNENLLCKLELSARYTQTLEVDKEIMSTYSKTDLAIAYTHETLLDMAKKMALRQNATPIETSIEVRELVALIFSTNKNLDRIDVLLRKLFWLEKKYGSIEPVVKLTFHLPYMLKYCTTQGGLYVHLKMRLYNREFENKFTFSEMNVPVTQDDLIRGYLTHEEIIPLYSVLVREGGHLVIDVEDEYDLLSYVTSSISENISHLTNDVYFY